MSFPSTNGPSQIRNTSRRINGKELPTQPSYEELQARIAELEAKQMRTLSIKIYDGVLSNGDQGKGTVAVVGLRRFPVPLYAQEWERIFAGVTPPAGTFAFQLLEACKSPRASRK